MSKEEIVRYVINNQMYVSVKGNRKRRIFDKYDETCRLLSSFRIKDMQVISVLWKSGGNYMRPCELLVSIFFSGAKERTVFAILMKESSPKSSFDVILHNVRRGAPFANILLLNPRFNAESIERPRTLIKF